MAGSAGERGSVMAQVMVDRRESVGGASVPKACHPFDDDGAHHFKFQLLFIPPFQSDRIVCGMS